MAMESSSTIEFTIKESSPPVAISTISQTMTYMFFANLGVTIISNFITGASMEMFWVMMNTLQLVYYLRLLSLYYPSHTITMFKYLNYANFETKFSSYLTKSLFGPSFFPEESLNPQFFTFGYKSSNYIANFADKIPFISLFTLWGILLFAFTSCWAKGKNS